MRRFRSTVLGRDQFGNPSCVPSICNADTCGPNEDCVVQSQTSAAGVVANVAACVCKAGYFRQDGVCVSITTRPCDQGLVRDQKT